MKFRVSLKESACYSAGFNGGNTVHIMWYMLQYDSQYTFLVLTKPILLYSVSITLQLH